MRLVHNVGSLLEIIPEGRREPAFTLVYAGAPKPFLHPVRTPSGHVLSLFEPHDHIWHRGMWFTIKYVNGVNFWEEQDGFGTLSVQGIPQVSHADPDRVSVRMEIEWRGPDGDVPIMEERSITYRPGEEADSYDWEIRLIPAVDVDLDRTPFTTWGGYSGLSFRGARGWNIDRFLLSDGSAHQRPTGQTGHWSDASGALDGGIGSAGGVAILGHPENVRTPSPWYGGGGGSGNFLNAALLFHEPMHLGAGEALTLRYRVLVHDGPWNQKLVEQAYQQYLTEIC